MNLNDQLTSLPLSKRLKELGVPQKSVFYWYQPHVFKEREVVKLDEWYVAQAWGGIMPSGLSAFSVAELGEMLKSFRADRDWWDSSWNGEQWYASKMQTNDEGVEVRRDNFFADTEADARALLFVYLIEQGLYSPSTEQGEKV